MNPAPDPGGSSRERRIPAATSDMELLRYYEPVIRYTQGEQFFPMDVVRYVAACNLWAHYPNGRDELLVRQEYLTIDSLTEARPADFGTVHYLRFVENLSLSESADVLARQIRLRRRLKNTFHPGLGRLARGGLLPPIVDALFSLSFFMRGRVPAASGRRRAGLFPHARPARDLHVLRTRGSSESLDRSSVLVLLLLQQLALRLRGRERPRIRLGDDLRLPLRGQWPSCARMGCLRLA